MKCVNGIKFSLLIVTLPVIINACSNGEQKNGENKSPEKVIEAVTPTVEIASLTKSILQGELQIPGELTAYQSVDIYAKESSFVKKLYADVGTVVREGQLLASLEAPEINQAIASAQSKLKSQEALYLASKANYDRLHETSKTPGTISPNDLDQALAKKNSDYAQLEAAKANYNQLIETRNYLSVKAPFGGIITTRNVSAGAYVGPAGKGSEAPIFTLQQQDKLRLIVSVPEAYSNYLAANSKVNFSVNAIAGKVFTAQVKRMSGALDSKLRAERIEMDVDNSGKVLLPGMIAEVKLTVKPADSTFIVPKSAILNNTEGVFIIRCVNGKAEWVNIKKGREVDNKVEVFGALNLSDQIVQHASEEIRKGTPVNLKK
jgi:membrane fusion protein (multidrug efflux system)